MNISRAALYRRERAVQHSRDALFSEQDRKRLVIPQAARFNFYQTQPEANSQDENRKGQQARRQTFHDSSSGRAKRIAIIIESRKRPPFRNTSRRTPSRSKPSFSYTCSARSLSPKTSSSRRLTSGL